MVTPDDKDFLLNQSKQEIEETIDQIMEHSHKDRDDIRKILEDLVEDLGSNFYYRGWENGYDQKVKEEEDEW